MQDSFSGNNQVEKLIRAFPSQLYLRQSPNKGKDIGGKLLMMDAYLKLGVKSDYILLLHDKRSPYHHKSLQWQEELFRIAKKDLIPEVYSLFEHNSKIGIIASANNIRNEADNDQQRNAYTDSSFINALKHRYRIHPPGLQYVTGTMFWVRAELFEEFFTQYNPLIIRSELEDGNVTDESPTNAHAWERLLCWMVTAKGFQIKGI